MVSPRARFPVAPRLLEVSELADRQNEDNSFIETGYRPATPSLEACLASWWYLHNETVNVMSHLFGALLFYMLPPILYAYVDRGLLPVSACEMAVFAIYLYGVAGSYAFSVAFHTLISHSPGGMAFGMQLDFHGIILLIWSATAPLVYYTFHDDQSLQVFYWTLSSTFALLTGIVIFTPAFRAPEAQHLRAGLFGSLALSRLICVIHGIALNGWHEQDGRFPMWSIGLTLLFNTTGATIYVLRFPERWWQRRFDLFGASHQLMHVSILIASFMWLGGMLEAIEHLHGRAVR